MQTATPNTTDNLAPAMFDFCPEEGTRKHVRTLTDPDTGMIWFVAGDVCKVLGFSDTNAGTRHLDEDEKMTVKLTGISSTNPVTVLVNEPGMYSLVLKSRKPEAKAFKPSVSQMQRRPQARKGRVAGLPGAADRLPLRVCSR